MEEFNQIEVPPSFMALYTAPGGHALLEPISFIRERYELCEDLAQVLMEPASTAHFQAGGSELQVLEKMEFALNTPDSPVQPLEAGWVVTRLAELLGW